MELENTKTQNKEGIKSMKKEPLISVLVANYNNGKYLMEAIESVRQQTYANWEIVLMDDASTDNSEDIYAELKKDERIHIYRNEQNMGCGYTKHLCVLHASGEYCGFLDPDDVLLPDALRISVEALNANPKAALTMSRYYFCDAELNITAESRLLQLKDGESYLEHHDFMPEVFSAWRKSAYEKSGGLNTLYKAAVDQDLYFRLEEQGSIVVLDAFTYKYRIIDSSVSRNDRKSYFWNQMARFEACVRRGLPIDQNIYPDFVAFCEHEKRSGAAEVLDSRPYRVGKKIANIFKLKKK